MKEKIKTTLTVLAIIGLSLASVAAIIFGSSEYQSTFPPKL